jgi:hypothetical protein
MITLCVIPNLKVENSTDFLSCLTITLLLDSLYMIPLIVNLMK